ncbi:VIT domain-containing protein [Sphingomonas sp. SAFR-052]|uniref:VIT domain-containing protein n=1 Tax=Sphingomonas sp. SAFR-052 TaxID=3436867 RepID=UPI003F81F09E
MLRLVISAVALVALSPSALAQSNPTLSEAERGIRRDGEATSHLRIDALNLRVDIVGRTADVTVEMVIGSDDPDPYEANLALTLPPDAVVTGYALDVDGNMIPGQLLEAPKARNVYEDQVRGAIDPGLAEVAGNRFTTRIFPITARQPRRFRLAFVAAFDPATGLVLPFARDMAIRQVTVAVTASGYQVAPAVRFAAQPIELTRRAADWHGEAMLGSATLRDGLTVTGGTLAAPMLVTRHPAGQAFFVISDGAATAPKPAARTGRLRIYWDRSLSHRADRTDLEAELLARLVERTAPTAIDLVTFASDRPRVTTFTDAAALRAALSRVTYRGATSLAGLGTLPLPAATQCVLVSDGAVTIDRGAAFAPDCRLNALTTAPGADGARLGRLVQRTGGTVIRLTPGGEGAALATLAARDRTPVAVRDAAGRPLDVRSFPAGPGRWLLVGPMPASGGPVVRLSDGSERRYANAAAEETAEAPGALWAANRIAALADDPAQHAAMADTARRYQVAGPGMSFLVLEQPDQYLRADLTPPPGFGKSWLARYADAKREHDADRARARELRFGFVLDQWRDRRAWWNKRFVPRSRAKVKQERFDGQPVAVPPPPPPAPPAPTVPLPPLTVTSAPPPPPAETIDAANIVVTAQRASARTPPAPDRPARAIRLDMADLIAKRSYISALDAAAPARRLTVLAEQERQFGTVPTFYLDTAEWFRVKGDAATASSLLLSALELVTSDDETRQIVAFRLERDRAYDRAVELAEQLAAANATFRPQPVRDLALALAARGRDAGKAGRADLERAFRLLVDTALNPASRDFDGIEVIALMEANALVPRIEAAGGRWTLDPRLVGLTATDARIVMEWTADDADIDLWVEEPNGERVMYSHPLSSAGGQISNDMTDGYGPEEYAIRRAPAGNYGVRVNGYDADRINPNGPGHVLMRLQRNFARPDEQQELVDLDLSFQTGRNRDAEGNTTPVATLRVAPDRTSPR